MKCNGAKILIETLIDEGVDTVFGYPGGTVIFIYDELYKSSGRISHIMTCHEQGACHAADGYARATGKTGVVIATSGPGATNLVTGIATAYLDSSPLVAITGNVATSAIGRDSFQEVDIVGATMGMTKHNYIVKDVTKLEETIREAFYLAKNGRPGPVLIDIPKDIQTAMYEYTASQRMKDDDACSYTELELTKALELINKAERPFLYVGGGVVSSDATQEVMDLAELIDAPIGSSMMGLSAMPASCPRFLGMTGMHGNLLVNSAKAQADLIIAIGTRFSDRATGNRENFSKGKKILHCDIDFAEIGKNIAAYASLKGDVKKVLAALNASLVKKERSVWNVEITRLRKEHKHHMDMNADSLNPQMIIEAVHKFVGNDAIVATDVGQHQIWVAQYYPFEKRRSFISSGGLGTMGFGMGAAIGASIATAKRTVLFSSDGSFHMNMNELATAVSQKLPLLVVLLNNGVLGMVRQWQNLFFDKRYAETTPGRLTDYAALAVAFGAQGRRVEAVSELDKALRWAMECEGPVVLDVPIQKDYMVLPMIPPNGTIENVIARRQ